MSGRFAAVRPVLERLLSSRNYAPEPVCVKWAENGETRGTCRPPPPDEEWSSDCIEMIPDRFERDCVSCSSTKLGRVCEASRFAGEGHSRPAENDDAMPCREIKSPSLSAGETRSGDLPDDRLSLIV